MPEGVVEGFRAARALGIVVIETDVPLTPDMLKYFNQPE
jgi:glycerophosphoryl diester phosphodiesterase